MKGQPVDRLDLLRFGEQVDRLDLLAQVAKEVGPGVRPVGERIEHAGLLADEEPVAARTAGEEQGMLELQIRKDPNDLERRRRIGRADDPRGRPGRATGLRGLGASWLERFIRGRSEMCQRRGGEQ